MDKDSITTAGLTRFPGEQPLQSDLKAWIEHVERILKGKYIEIYWDGEAEWFEAEVLAYDETRKKHFVRYSADLYECEENLMGVGEEPSPWRHVIKTTARGASSKAKAAESARKESGFVVPPPPAVPAPPP